MVGSFRRNRAIWVGGGFAAALLFDVVTKWLIINAVMVPPRLIELTPFFNLTLGFNTGVSFGMFQDFFIERPLLLAGIKVVIAVALVVWAMRTDRAIEATAFGLIAGGAAGNMICVHNVVAASATVGLVNREGEIIRMTLIPMTYYIVQGGFIGLALLAGGFNMWWIAAVIWGSAVLLVMSRNRGRASNPVAVRS